MSKIWKTIQFLFNLLINLVVLGAIGILLAWLIWDVSPQRSFANIAYFFSETHAIVTGKKQIPPASSSETSDQN